MRSAIPATMDHYNEYHRIRSESKNLYWTGYAHAPEYTGFRNWFRERLADTKRELYMLFENEVCVGALHIDYYDTYAAIGYSIKEAFEGRGLATFGVTEALRIVKKACPERPGLGEVRAWINENNVASRRVVEKNDFRRTDNKEVRDRLGCAEIYIEYAIDI